MKNLILFPFCIISLFIISCSDPCDNLDCGPGTCIDGTCDCPENFSGVNCEIEDLCFNADCGNGNCDEGTGECICDEGYEGANCEIRIKDKYLGTWSTPEWDCMLGSPGSFTFRFDDMPDNEMSLYFVDPYEEDVLVNTTIQSESFNIEMQTFNVGGDVYDIFGDGTLIDGIITLNLSVAIPLDGFEATCIGIFTKQ